MGSESRFNRIVSILLALFLFMTGISLSENASIFKELSKSDISTTASKDILNLLYATNCDLSLEDPQSRNNLKDASELAIHYRSAVTFNRLQLLLYCLHKTILLPTILWFSYLFIKREKIIPLLFTILYIHKSDGKKWATHILQNS